MNSKAIRYRDTFAAPGSQLFEALENGQTAKALEIYESCRHAALALELGVSEQELWRMRSVHNTQYRDARLPQWAV